ncbi:MAG: hypothetical protein RML94_15800, partial [Bacteroidia bacterium]|nr:hypothetical protein [Bacteroidia bacterium]
QNDSLFLLRLSQHLGRPLPQSFFVIQATTALTPYSNAQQILFNLKDIKNYQLSPYVVYLWKDELPVGARHLPGYFEKNYYLKPDEHTFIVVSDTLYDMLYRPGYDVHLYYFHEGRRLFSANGKYQGIPDTLLPYALLRLGPVEEFAFEDTVYRHDNLEMLYPLSDSLAISLAEDHFAPIRLVHLPDGRVFNVFRPTSKVVKDWIHSYLNSKKYSFEEISRGVELLDTVRRSSFNPSVVFVKDSSRIFIVCLLSIYAPSKTKKIYTPTPFPGLPSWKNSQNDIVQVSGDLIIQMNRKSLKIEKLFFLDNNQKNTFYRKHFLETPNGFYWHKDTFYIYGYKFREDRDKSYDHFYRRNKKTPFVHLFVAEGETLRYVRTAKSKLQRNFKVFYHAAPYYYFFKCPGGIYVFNQYFPEIYHLNKKKPDKFWVKNPKSLRYKFSGYNDTSYSVIPFFSFRPFFIGGQKVMALLTIQNEWDLSLKLYLPDLKCIQEVPLNPYLPEKYLRRMWNMDEGHYFITDKYIYFYHCFKKEGCKLLRIKYDLNPINPNCIFWQDYFER